MERYGAKVVLCAPTQTARTQTAYAEAERMGGAAFVHPYDDELVLAGQGTIGIELMEQLPTLDAVLVPVSGGGMIGGIACAVKGLQPGVRVIAVEPAGKELQKSLESRTRVLDGSTANLALDTIADAIRTKALGPIPWTIASDLLEPTVISVGDEEIKSAMRYSLIEMKQVVEPAGALTLAALFSPAFATLREQHQLRNVAAVVCGGNVDPEAYAQMIAR